MGDCTKMNLRPKPSREEIRKNRERRFRDARMRDERMQMQSDWALRVRTDPDEEVTRWIEALCITEDWWISAGEQMFREHGRYRLHDVVDHAIRNYYENEILDYSALGCFDGLILEGERSPDIYAHGSGFSERLQVLVREHAGNKEREELPDDVEPCEVEGDNIHWAFDPRFLNDMCEADRVRFWNDAFAVKQASFIQDTIPDALFADDLL